MLSAICSLVLAPAIRYSYTELPLLPGGTVAAAHDINDSGVIVGDADTPSVWLEHKYLGTRACLWKDGRVVELGMLRPGLNSDVPGSHAYAVNNSGVVVGGSGGYFPMFMSGLVDATAFRWSQGKLQALPGSSGSFEALDINDSGTIVGSDGHRGFARSASKTREVGTASTRGAGNLSCANGINRQGLIVGLTTVNRPGDDMLPCRPFLFERGRMKVLPVPKGTENAFASKISDSGTIIGATRSGDGTTGAALCWRQGRVQVLPALARAQRTEALGVGGSVIVGTSGEKAVLWKGGAVTDLNEAADLPPGVSLVSAEAVNAKGWIVGVAQRDGKKRAFLLKPRD